MLHAALLRDRPARPDAVADWAAQQRTALAAARDARLRAYYTTPWPAADAVLDGVQLVAMDIETTGLDPVRDGIVSIGLVPMTLQRIEASRSRHWLVKPRVALGAEAVTIHGITDAAIDGAPDLLDVLDEVLGCLAGRLPVVHCRAVERPFLDQALRVRLGEGLVCPLIDTMALEARVQRPAHTGWLARLMGRGPAPAPSLRLADARPRYGLPRYRPHHALTDALATAELLQAQISHHFPAGVRVGEVWG